MPGILCEHCTAACCRYVALPIDEPQDRSDFDDIRWYLLHDEVSVFVEDGEWFISFATSCRNLLPDHRCGIYETRPRICREYTADNCDYHSGDYGWELHFTSVEHLDTYVAEKFARGESKPRKSNGKSVGRTARGRLKARPGRLPKKRTATPSTEQKDRFGVSLPVL